MFLKVTAISTLLMLVLVGPMQVSAAETLSASSDTQTDGGDCFYEVNRTKPECR
ncbi:MAG: hypothetical protein HY081_05235 [Gammaproteobacteria bacterium]|nr:hypothetical protein [Gammaproteobacteria bacterium]